MAADFQDVQRAMARYLRDPNGQPAPEGVEDRRIGIYRYAVFANALEFMSDNFPRLRDVIPRGAWEAMVRDYFIRHPAGTHLFCELPHEFLSYLRGRGIRPGDPEYLLELAEFECLENDVAID
ncbi:MAG: DNA-binding domain-containing protein, partial [Gammaproteobacteria bacterium]|nr:DNA-binding domain-containing protein [Gammaproteobacteria bacterium]